MKDKDVAGTADDMAKLCLGEPFHLLRIRKQEDVYDLLLHCMGSIHEKAIESALKDDVSLTHIMMLNCYGVVAKTLIEVLRHNPQYESDLLSDQMKAAFEDAIKTSSFTIHKITRKQRRELQGK